MDRELPAIGAPHQCAKFRQLGCLVQPVAFRLRRARSLAMSKDKEKQRDPSKDLEYLERILFPNRYVNVTYALAFNVSIALVLLYFFKPRDIYLHYSYVHQGDILSALWDIHWALKTYLVYLCLFFFVGSRKEAIKYFFTLWTCSLKAWDKLNDEEKERRAAASVAAEALSKSHLGSASLSSERVCS